MQFRSLVVLGIAFTTGVSAAFAGPTHTQMENASWKHLTDKNHQDAGTVKVFTSTVSGVSCFRATSEVKDLEMKDLFGVVVDIESTTKWSSAGITQAEILGTVPGKSADYFEYLDTPGWTFSADRFWFVRSTFSVGKDYMKTKWAKLEDGGDHKERYQEVKKKHPSAVEPPVNAGAWIFRKGESTVGIEYFVCTDAGGSIPAAVQSAATRKTLPDTLGDVVREARRRKK